MMQQGKARPGYQNLHEDPYNDDEPMEDRYANLRPSSRIEEYDENVLRDNGVTDEQIKIKFSTFHHFPPQLLKTFHFEGVFTTQKSMKSAKILHSTITIIGGRKWRQNPILGRIYPMMDKFHAKKCVLQLF
jgi:hypothetical protein